MVATETPTVYWCDGRELYEQTGCTENGVLLTNSRTGYPLPVPYEELERRPWRLILPDEPE